MLTSSMLLDNNPTIALTDKNYETVEISLGDTLWKIASEYAPENMDVRRAVYKLQKFNNLTATDLMPGMVIRIPDF